MTDFIFDNIPQKKTTLQLTEAAVTITRKHSYKQ